MILGAWLFLKGIYDFLMRISIPLLLAGLAVAVFSIPPTFKWATTAGELKKSEKRVERLTTSLEQCGADLERANETIAEQDAKIGRQNDEVRKLEIASKTATKRADEAIRKAEEQARVFRNKEARLRAVKPSGDICEAGRDIMFNSLKEDRQ